MKVCTSLMYLRGERELKVKSTGQNEDWKHYLVKCILCKILKDLGHKIYTEVDKGQGRVDVFDSTTGVVYEIETHPKKATSESKVERYSKSVYVKEVVIIDASQFSNLHQLREFKYTAEMLEMEVRS